MQYRLKGPKNTEDMFCAYYANFPNCMDLNKYVYFRHDKENTIHIIKHAMQN